MADVNVCEVFTSIQGESSYAGQTCLFIRLSGCNLRCTYCDTAHAYGPGRDTPIAELVAQAAASRACLVEITGGEPLLQPWFRELAEALRDGAGKPVLVETNGSQDLSLVPSSVIAVMDVKCPGSGEAGSTDPKNFARLQPADEVKFVLGDRADYDWAVETVVEHDLASVCHAVLFSPVWGRLEPGELGRWIVADGLSVRLQVPLHRVLGCR